MSENEKDKETKEASETENYVVYEGEAIEDVAEGSVPEDVSASESSLSFKMDQYSPGVQASDSEESIPETDEERKLQLLREKWLTVTGKKPRNIPTLRKPFEEGTRRHIFFGDRKPEEVEKSIRRKLLIAAHKIETKGLKFGKVQQEVRLPALFSGLLCIRFDPSAEFMACSNRKGGVEIRKTSTGEVLVHLSTIEETEKLAVRSVRYFPQNPEKVYVVGQTGSIQVFKTGTGALLAASEPFGTTYNMDISSDGFFLAIGGKDGKLFVIDPYTLQVISKRAWPDKGEPATYEDYHRLRIYGMKFHPINTNLFATGGWDNSVKIWDVRTQPAIRSINGPAVYGDGLDMKNDVILTATWRAEGSLNLWDFQSGKKIKNIPIYSKSTKYEGEFLYTCRFFKDDPAFPAVNSNLVAIGGSGFSDVLVINTKNDQIEQYFPSFKPILCLDISGNLLAYGGTESVFRVAQMEGNRQKSRSNS